MNFIAKVSFVFVLAFNFSQVTAQTNGFVKSDRATTGEHLMPRTNYPTKYQIFDANFKSVNDYLLNAPLESAAFNTTFTINLPDADGNIVPYAVFKSPVMEQELASEFQGLYSYVGYNTKDATNNIRIAVSYVHGIHVMGYNGKGETYYIDTFTQNLNSYILYKRSDISESRDAFECNTQSETAELEMQGLLPQQTFSQDAKFRQYRLAMACTIEYASFHVQNAPAGTPSATEAQKKAIVLSAMQVTVARLNTVYERDLSVRFVLVANNSSIIFVNSDNFNNSSAGVLIGQSQSVINSTIGSANYDIGHTVSTGGGGLAGLGVICSNSNKARGITGSYAPVGDPFDIDYVAHEVGHQMGAEHTFNGTTGSCQGNIGNVSAEPGSGSTIMAYAGICPGQNVQQNSDAYFHYYSIQQMFNRISTSGSCATIISTSNATPTANAGLDYTIPRSTPFKLTATGTDANNANSLTYTWEQLDTQGISYPMTGSLAYGPNFRSVAPTASPTRYFPAYNVVLAGTTNATAVPNSQWEKLPSVARLMQFGVTVRDNDPVNGGQTKRDVTNINVANVGPFILTYPDNVTSTPAIQWLIGSTQTITWNVAGTNGNGINTSNVNVLYSADNGVTFTSLASNVPNNGSAVITTPNLPNNTEIRIKIEPVGNVYYAISKKVKLVTTLSNVDFRFEDFKLYPNPTNDQVTFSFVSENSNQINYQLYDLNGRLILDRTVENVMHIQETVSLDRLSSGTYLLRISDGTNSMSSKIIKK